MKVKKIIEAKKEYEKLQSLIDNIENALKNFEKQETRKNNILYLSGTFQMNGWAIAETETEKTETVNVYLNSEVSKLLKPEIVALLNTRLADLKKQQDNLEI